MLLKGKKRILLYRYDGVFIRDIWRRVEISHQRLFVSYDGKPHEVERGEGGEVFKLVLPEI